MTSILAQRLSRHVETLARDRGVEIIYQGRGIAYRKERRVTIPRVRGRVSYFTALHELGHVLGPNPPRRLDQEVAAWRWALEHSIVEPTPFVIQGVTRSLTSYRRRAEQARYGTVLPDGFDDFISYLKGLL